MLWLITVFFDFETVAWGLRPESVFLSQCTRASSQRSPVPCQHFSDKEKHYMDPYNNFIIITLFVVCLFSNTFQDRITKCFVKKSLRNKIEEFSGEALTGKMYIECETYEPAFCWKWNMSFGAYCSIGQRENEPYYREIARSVKYRNTIWVDTITRFLTSLSFVVS